MKTTLNKCSFGKNCMQSFFFLISNKNSLILKKRHPSTQGVYKGEQIKNENNSKNLTDQPLKPLCYE